jgi:hypothetical protein
MCPHPARCVRTPLIERRPSGSHRVQSIKLTTSDKNEVITIHMSLYCYTCVLILLYVSSYRFVLIPLYVCPHAGMCPHTAIEVSSYRYICVRIQLHMCPRTAIYFLILHCLCELPCILILLYMCRQTICIGELLRALTAVDAGILLYSGSIQALFRLF